MYKHYPYDDVENGLVASASECTGLVPMTPESFDSLDSYTDMYDVPLPKNCTNRRRIMNNQNSNKSQNTDKYSNQNSNQNSNQSSNQNSNRKDSNQSSNKKDSNSNSNQNSNRKDY